MNFRHKPREEPNLNLTPLIDVVFLLLIFFMLTTTFSHESQLSIHLPQADSTKEILSPQKIEVAVNQKGEFFVNEKALVNRQLATLARAIEQQAQGDHTIALVITGDAQAPHQAIVNAMDVAGKLGFAKLSITTRARDS